MERKCIVCGVKLDKNVKYCGRRCERKAYKLRNPERYKEQRDRWLAKHPNYMSDYGKKYLKKRKGYFERYNTKRRKERKEHPTPKREPISKICPICGMMIEGGTSRKYHKECRPKYYYDVKGKNKLICIICHNEFWASRRECCTQKCQTENQKNKRGKIKVVDIRDVIGRIKLTKERRYWVITAKEYKFTKVSPIRINGNKFKFNKSNPTLFDDYGKAKEEFYKLRMQKNSYKYSFKVIVWKPKKSGKE